MRDDPQTANDSRHVCRGELVQNDGTLGPVGDALSAALPAPPSGGSEPGIIGAFFGTVGDTGFAPGSWVRLPLEPYVPSGEVALFDATDPLSITALVAGTYILDGLVWNLSDPEANKGMQAQLELHGSGEDGGMVSDEVSLSPRSIDPWGRAAVHLSGAWRLAVGDIVRVQVLHNAAGPLFITCQLSVVCLPSAADG